MAHLRNLDRIWTARAGAAATVGHNRTMTRESRDDGTTVFTCRLHGATVTVGHNRTITRESRDDGTTVFTCRLHGYPIVTVTPHGASGTATVKLDACGHLTTTTISAMRDFMAAFGIAGSASRASGVLSARWYMDDWKERESSNGESMSFAAARNPVLA